MTQCIYLFVVGLVAITAAARADVLTEQGWNPSLRSRRISTQNPPGDPYYFETCPDDPQGCQGLAKGEGFHTLAAGSGFYPKLSCRVNSGGACPFYFYWDGGAALGMVTTAYPNAASQNTFIGLQDNVGGDGRVGGFDHPLISKAATAFEAKVQYVYVPRGTHVRIVTGIAWWTPRGSHVLEINLDSISTFREWSTTERVVRNESCIGDVNCIYMGGRAWGYESVIGTTFRRVAVDWGLIAKRLQYEGWLPADALGEYIADAWYTGIEVVGGVLVGVQIRDRHIYGIERSPFGFFDGVTGGLATGWAFDWDSPTTALKVKLYRDKPYPFGVPVKEVTAGLSGPPGYPGSHRFSVPVTVGKTYFAHAVDAETGEVVVLNGGGKR